MKSDARVSSPVQARMWKFAWTRAWASGRVTARLSGRACAGAVFRALAGAITGAISPAPILAMALALAPAAQAMAQGSIVVQSTTSTQNAGFYAHVVPAFAARSGIDVRVVAVGTGQALKNARNCDGDLLIVHATPAEQKFVDDGYGAARHDLMFNDFVIVGPRSDPARVAAAGSVDEALLRIAESGLRFATRGDQSGTHQKEMALWRTTGFTPVSRPGGWYLETGSAMGATLNFAVQSDSYTLSDRASWLAFANKFEHEILFAGDARMFNQYGVVTINPAHCPRANHTAAHRFAKWLLSPVGQARIATLTLHGQPLFTPNAAALRN